MRGYTNGDLQESVAVVEIRVDVKSICNDEHNITYMQSLCVSTPCEGVEVNPLPTNDAHAS